jgi:hypothetical protein
MSQSPRPPKLNSTHQASARLNAWAADTLSALTSEEEATDKHDRTVTEDGNRYFAWAVAWLFPTLFFTLIGTHGLHVTFGLIWIIVLLDMIRRHGLDSINKRRLACLSLFWHFLDIVWICVFTFVYLLGAI